MIDTTLCLEHHAQSYFMLAFWAVTSYKVTFREVICEYKDLKMAVPKRKTSKSKRNMRRSHHTLGDTNWVEDQHSGEPKRRHHIDLKTGMYKGKQVVDPRD